MSKKHPANLDEMKADPMRCSECGRSHVLDYADPMPGMSPGYYFIPGYKYCPCGTSLFGALTNLPPTQATILARGFFEMLGEDEMDDSLEAYNNARMGRTPRRKAS